MRGTFAGTKRRLRNDLPKSKEPGQKGHDASACDKCSRSCGGSGVGHRHGSYSGGSRIAYKGRGECARSLGQGVKVRHAAVAATGEGRQETSQRGVWMCEEFEAACHLLQCLT